MQGRTAVRKLNLCAKRARCSGGNIVRMCQWTNVPIGTPQPLRVACDVGMFLPEQNDRRRNGMNVPIGTIEHMFRLEHSRLCSNRNIMLIVPVGAPWNRIRLLRPVSRSHPTFMHYGACSLLLPPRKQLGIDRSGPLLIISVRDYLSGARGNGKWGLGRRGAKKGGRRLNAWLRPGMNRSGEPDVRRERGGWPLLGEFCPGVRRRGELLRRMRTEGGFRHGRFVYRYPSM
jgi:hypothetical protein